MSKDNKRNKLSSYMFAPFRALVRARDMYVGACLGQVHNSRIVASRSRGQSNGFYKPRTSSGEEDLGELIRAASQGTLGSLNSAARLENPTVVPRSQSVAVGVGIARIDEDQVCEFSDESAYPRSRSCAVVAGRRTVQVK